MVNPSVITNRVEQIEKHLERIRPFASLSHEAFLKDNVAQDVVEYNLFQIVNHLIDIFQHTVVDEEYGFPETAYEAAQILFEKKILFQEDVEIFKQMVGFRNVVGHDYMKLPAHRAGLPGNVTSFYIVPLDPAYKAGLAGHVPANVDKEIVYYILTHGEKDIRALLTRIVSRFL